MPSATQVTVRNITASDVRSVMANIGREIATIAQFARGRSINPSFNLDDTIVDLSLLALNDIISSIHLQFYRGNTLVREYAYVILQEGRGSSGTSPDSPPLPSSLPSDVQLRLVIKRNPNLPKSTCDEWFRRLKWGSASALTVPANLRRSTYGSYGSGGYGMDRILLAGDDDDSGYATPYR